MVIAIFIFEWYNSVTLRTADVMVLLHYYKMWNKSNLNVINQMKHLLLDVRYSTLTIFFSFVYFSRTENENWEYILLNESSPYRITRKEKKHSSTSYKHGRVQLRTNNNNREDDENDDDVDAYKCNTKVVVFKDNNSKSFAVLSRTIRKSHPIYSLWVYVGLT